MLYPGDGVGRRVRPRLRERVRCVPARDPGPHSRQRHPARTRRPRPGRPHADTLKGSKHARMKELRCDTTAWAHRLRLRPRAPSHTPGGRGQIRRQREALLPAADREGGRAARQPPRPKESPRGGMRPMARTLQDKMAQLTPERRVRIEAEADRLHAEYLTLRDLRKAREPARRRPPHPPGERRPAGEAQRPPALDAAQLRRSHGRTPRAAGRVPGPRPGRPGRAR
jgi:hypothetical protein